MEGMGGELGWDSRIEEAILRGALAGACRTWARREPAAARGLTRKANHESTLAGALLGEWLDQGRETGEGALPCHQQGRADPAGPL